MTFVLDAAVPITFTCMWGGGNFSDFLKPPPPKSKGSSLQIIPLRQSTLHIHTQTRTRTHSLTHSQTNALLWWSPTVRAEAPSTALLTSKRYKREGEKERKVTVEYINEEIRHSRVSEWKWPTGAYSTPIMMLLYVCVVSMVCATCVHVYTCVLCTCLYGVCACLDACMCCICANAAHAIHGRALLRKMPAQQRPSLRHAISHLLRPRS